MALRCVLLQQAFIIFFARHKTRRDETSQTKKTSEKMDQRCTGDAAALSYQMLQQRWRGRGMPPVCRQTLGLYQAWSDDEAVLSLVRRQVGIFTSSSTAVQGKEARRGQRATACLCRDFVIISADFGVYVCPRHFFVHRCGRRWSDLFDWLPALDPLSTRCPAHKKNFDNDIKEKRNNDSGDRTGDSDLCCAHTGRQLQSVTFVSADELNSTTDLHFGVYGGRGCRRNGKGECGEGRAPLLQLCASVRGRRRRGNEEDVVFQLNARRKRLMHAGISSAVAAFVDDSKRRRYNDALKTRWSSKNKGRKNDNEKEQLRDRLLSVGQITGGIRSMLQAHVKFACDRLYPAMIKSGSCSGIRDHRKKDGSLLHISLKANAATSHSCFGSLAFCVLNRVVAGVHSEGKTIIPSLPFRCLLPLPSEKGFADSFGYPLKKYSQICNALHLALRGEPFDSVVWPIQTTSASTVVG